MMDCRAVQQMAKDTTAYIKTEICPGMPLNVVRRRCEQRLLALGADSFWYYDIGAFVFAGEDTVLSVSGRNYETAEREIHADDILTIDLSPQVGDIWGDYARTIVIENGTVVEAVADIRRCDVRQALEMEQLLHENLMRFATPDTAFEQLYDHANELIRAHGYQNLDFLGNLGHSIVRRREERIYIERGNSVRLGDVDRFTFEPHIRKTGASFGVKREDIYYFENGLLQRL